MSEARIWEEEVVIPTYEAGEPDKNPMFLEKRVYQGSSGKVYPYPTTEKISRVKMLMYGKEASNRKQEIDRQHYTIPNQRPKDKHCGKI